VNRIGWDCRLKDSPVIGCVIATIRVFTRRPEGELRYVIAWPHGPEIKKGVYTDEAEEDLIFLLPPEKEGRRVKKR
jgi:hypothetical protein